MLARRGEEAVEVRAGELGLEVVVVGVGRVVRGGLDDEVTRVRLLGGEDDDAGAVVDLGGGEDLDEDGGLDETFVAGLLREVADDETPTMLNTETVLGIRKELTEEEFEQLRSAWLRNYDAGPRPMRVVGAGPPFRGYLREIVDTPPAHQHIWSTTSPMRCVECRRYLRPWWRRLADRLRRRPR